ncbi:50S ribosomal protein L25/general stress protein Ctc [Bacteroidales bacterium OttesenSCG-928-C19]|nr:50S ribosomal protein L25/general stress protein Ctc [Bacteroidales bacterium OttesenSCG-928-C19]
MKTVSMSGSLRENVGKKDAKALRAEEKVPCVIYGTGEQIQFSVEQKAFKPLLFTPEVHFVELDIAGTKKKAILQDIQYHPVTDEVIHADFMELQDNKAITMRIPVKTKGNSPGVLRGGKLEYKLKRVKVKALPGNMPENITVDISPLDITHGVMVEQIPTGDYEILEGKTNYVVYIKPTRSSGK